VDPAPPDPTSPPAAPALARHLGLFDITMLVMGSVIGAGIFAVPNNVARLVGTSTLVLAAWVVGGIVMMAGALVYGELARRRPYVGGQYAFLREAYHPAVAFVYGWSLLWIIQSGGIASVALIFGRYFLELVHLFADWLGPEGPWSSFAASLNRWTEAANGQVVVGAAAVGLLAAINCAGVRAGGTTQDVFMVLKILAIGGLILCGWLVAGAADLLPGDQGSSTGDPPAGGSWATLTAFAAAMVPVLFAYGGSHTTTFMAGEIREPGRTLPRGLILGMVGVIVLYVGVNAVCLRVLGVQELAANERPASEVMNRALGGAGAAAISAAIAISTLGFLSQATLTSPRVYFAMAGDRLFFRHIAWVHPRTRAPVVAILLQGVFAIFIIVLMRRFERIVNNVMAAEMIFFALTALGLFVIRRRDAAAGAGGHGAMPGHPVTTLLFAAANVALVANLIYETPRESGTVIGLALAGLPVYFCWRVLARRSRDRKDEIS
jgi:APA family basic amino acid/polyamine antiporter